MPPSIAALADWSQHSAHLGLGKGGGHPNGCPNQRRILRAPAAALLIGLLGNALIGAWWLDPFVGLLIAFVAVQEGREAWRGEACCAD